MKRWPLAAIACVVAGAVAFVTGLKDGESARTFGALIASWLFFAGAAAGALAFRAFFRIVDARWARPLLGLAWMPAAFAPVAILLLVVIVAGAGLAPWLRPTDTDGFWLSLPFFGIRELGLTLVLFGFAAVKLRARPTRATALVYCLIFAVVLSVWGFDFVLGPAPGFVSTLIGPHVFMSAFIAGTGLTVLVGLVGGQLGEAERRDAGALVLALSIFWAYLFWSQYLTIWYGNLPDEVGFALRRHDGGWDVVVLAVLGLTFVAPFVSLLHPGGRRSRRLFAGVLVAQLLGLWLSFHLLVVPSLATTGSPPVGVRDVLIALGMLGAFTLTWARASRPGHLGTESSRGLSGVVDRD